MVVLFFLIVPSHPDSQIAPSIKLDGDGQIPVSQVVPGNWDVVCPIVEMASPERLVAEAKHENFAPATVGDQSTRRLFDGESGLVTISVERREYALFKVYDSDRGLIRTNGGMTTDQQCLPFSNAVLKRRQTHWTDGWLYLTLEGSPL